LHGVLTVVSKSRGLDTDNLESTSQFVDDEGGESFRLDIFGNKEKGLLLLHSVFEEGEERLN
jgi:hypothetical protein